MIGDSEVISHSPQIFDEVSQGSIVIPATIQGDHPNSTSPDFSVALRELIERDSMQIEKQTFLEQKPPAKKNLKKFTEHEDNIISRAAISLIANWAELLEEQKS